MLEGVRLFEPETDFTHDPDTKPERPLCKTWSEAGTLILPIRVLEDTIFQSDHTDTPDGLGLLSGSCRRRTPFCSSFPTGIIRLKTVVSLPCVEHWQPLPPIPFRNHFSDAGQPVLNGIDVLKEQGFRRLRGLKTGLITNHTGA